MSASAAVETGRAEHWRRFQANPLALFGLALLTLLAGLALAAPLLPLADPYAVALGERLLPAGSPGHWLGTDQLGRDMLIRVLDGGHATSRAHQRDHGAHDVEELLQESCSHE